MSLNCLGILLTGERLSSYAAVVILQINILNSSCLYHRIIVCPGQYSTSGIKNQWNGMVEWNGGMEWWNGMVEWNGGMEYWNNL